MRRFHVNIEATVGVDANTPEEAAQIAQQATWGTGNPAITPLYPADATATGTADLIVRCENPECKACGGVVNTISGVEPDDEETFIEGWRPEAEDVCPDCGVEGTLED